MAENRALTYWVSVATFVVIYLSMSILCADLLQWLLHFFLTDAARQTLFILCGFACLAFTLFFACYGYYKTTKIVTVQYPLASEKLARPLRIVQLSDLHIGFFVGEQHIRKTVEAVNRLQPDMVVISGDMINAANTLECPEIEAVERLLAQLHSVKGTYAVVGNHDPEVSDPDFQDFLKASDIHLLNDSVFADNDLQLVGRTTCTKPHLPLSALMQNLDSQRLTVVLDHDPIGIPQAVEAHADLVLCGHTHRGQVFPLAWFVRFLYSKQQLWGISRSGDTTSIVSAGTGFFTMPMRIGSDCEVVCIDIRPSANEQL